MDGVYRFQPASGEDGLGEGCIAGLLSVFTPKEFWEQIARLVREIS